MRVGLLIGVVVAALAFAGVAQGVVDPACRQGTTMVVAAHQDDTILFMSPDIVRDVRAGRCLRSVIIGSGAHADAAYMLSREQGMEAAEAQMVGVADSWTTTHVRQAGHWITEVSLAGAPGVTIDFLASDTNDAWPVGSSGNPANGDPSLLEALERGWLASMTTIDGPTVYTRQGLIDTLGQLMRRFGPSRVDTQDFVERYGPGDHADHRATAFLTMHAWRDEYGVGTLVSYQGYDVAGRPENVSGSDYAAKLAAFVAYEPFDGRVPQSAAAAEADQFYGNWMHREYVLSSVVAPAQTARAHRTGRKR